MAQYVINDHEGKEIIAIISSVPDHINEFFACNEIAEVCIESDGTVDIVDTYGNVVVTVDCGNREDAEDFVERLEISA